MMQDIHTIKDYIKATDPNAYYILDFNRYGLSKNNNILFEKFYMKTKRMIENSMILYRQPKRLAKNRKFNIYGGGFVYKIEECEDGYVALVKDGFLFSQPISEDDKNLNDMVWTSKTKKDGWDHFWSQYGINEINKEDTLNITEHSTLTLNNYSANVFNGLSNRRILEERALKLILDYENKRIRDYNLDPKCEAIAIPKIASLRYNYDILSYDNNGNEIHIKIKVLPFGQKNMIQISSKEYEMLHDPMFRIYTIFNIDLDANTFELFEDTGKEILERYDFEPLIYKGTLKKKEM